MNKKVILPNTAVKDDKGAYLPSNPPPPTPEVPVTPIKVTDVSIDELLSSGLTIIQRIMKCVQMDASTGSPSRESVMNLKDCMHMLHELKKKEQDLLDAMSDDELRDYLKKNSNETNNKGSGEEA